jgi:hypothetical protein
MGHRLWRNNVGLFYTKYGTPTRCGLCKGSSDLIGILQPTGQLLAVEAKAPGGARRSEQGDFIAVIKKMGGVGFYCESVSEFRAEIEKWQSTLKS